MTQEIDGPSLKIPVVYAPAYILLAFSGPCVGSVRLPDPLLNFCVFPDCFLERHRRHGKQSESKQNMRNGFGQNAENQREACKTSKR